MNGGFMDEFYSKGDSMGYQPTNSAYKMGFFMIYITNNMIYRCV